MPSDDPAFPIDHRNQIKGGGYTGMTLREYFVGQALAGTATLSGEVSAREAAHVAVMIADFALAELNK